MFIPTNGGRGLIYLPTPRSSHSSEQASCVENCQSSPASQIIVTICVAGLIISMLIWAISTIRKK